MTTDHARAEAVRSDLADVPVRWSWLYPLGTQSAAHGKFAALHGKEPTASMKLGTAGHAVAFDQPYEVFREQNPKTGKVLNRSSKAWQAFAADCKARNVAAITVKEYDHACRVRDALHGHPDAAPLLFGEGVIHEQRIAWERDGRACASTPDARKPGAWIADLKCVRTAMPRRFVAAAQYAGYPGQLRFYAEADAHTLGLSGPAFGVSLYVVAIEPFAPYCVTVFRLERSACEFGDRQVAQCWEALRAAEKSNAWGGYVESIASFDVVEQPAANDDFDIDDIDPPDEADQDDQEDL